MGRIWFRRKAEWSERMRDAYDKGILAFYEGKLQIEDNPFLCENNEWNEWNNGWLFSYEKEKAIDLVIAMNNSKHLNPLIDELEKTIAYHEEYKTFSEWIEYLKNKK